MDEWSIGCVWHKSCVLKAYQCTPFVLVSMQQSQCLEHFKEMMHSFTKLYSEVPWWIQITVATLFLVPEIRDFDIVSAAKHRGVWPILKFRFLDHHSPGWKLVPDPIYIILMLGSLWLCFGEQIVKLYEQSYLMIFIYLFLFGNRLVEDPGVSDHHWIIRMINKNMYL